MSNDLKLNDFNCISSHEYNNSYYLTKNDDENLFSYILNNLKKSSLKITSENQISSQKNTLEDSNINNKDIYNNPDNNINSTKNLDSPKRNDDCINTENIKSNIIENLETNHNDNSDIYADIYDINSRVEDLEEKQINLHDNKDKDINIYDINSYVEDLEEKQINLHDNKDINIDNIDNEYSLYNLSVIDNLDVNNNFYDKADDCILENGLLVFKNYYLIPSMYNSWCNNTNTNQFPLKRIDIDYSDNKIEYDDNNISSFGYIENLYYINLYDSIFKNTDNFSDDNSPIKYQKIQNGLFDFNNSALNFNLSNYDIIESIKDIDSETTFALQQINLKNFYIPEYSNTLVTVNSSLENEDTIVLSNAIINQIIAKLKIENDNNVSQFKLELFPKKLGYIEFDSKIIENEIIVKISTENFSTLRLLQNNINDLYKIIHPMLHNKHEKIYNPNNINNKEITIVFDLIKNKNEIFDDNNQNSEYYNKQDYNGASDYKEDKGFNYKQNPQDNPKDNSQNYNINIDNTFTNDDDDKNVFLLKDSNNIEYIYSKSKLNKIYDNIKNTLYDIILKKNF
ncbi:hypothetical protein [Lyticum sinuosum]|uniref:Uncharacterized protein n=1 Tax=Lyticum sinuosum TaxID=1332059 RepID=A0AAE4VKH3_9RICK|nr:hypothetical protein [Lyticum sinuosum]MDZ5761631.1 hypothetical protein [Lyticum sinuosum]